MKHTVQFLRSHGLQIKFAAAMLIFTLLALRMDWSMLETLTRNITISLTSIALLLILGQLMLVAYRWQMFMNVEKPLVGYPIALTITTASQLANFLFITSVGGIVVKIALARHYGLTLLKSVCATVADRLMTLLAIVVYAILFLPSITAIMPAAIGEGLMITAGLSLVIAFLFPSLLIGLLKPLIIKNRQVASTVIYMRRMVRRPELAGPVLASSLAAQIFYFLAVCFAGKSIGLTFDTAQMIAILPMITLISSLPIGLGGWGIREGAFVFGLGLIGIPTESAFLISVQIGLLGIIVTVLAAIPAFVTGGLQSVMQKAVMFKASSSS